MFEQINQTLDLTGRVALVTGGSSIGIGSASAKLFADAGAKVFLVSLPSEEDKLKERVAEIEAAGGSAAYFTGDVANEEDCKAAVEKCVETYGRLDIMLLAAGISGLSARTLDDDFNTDNYRRMMAVNLDGTFWMMKYGHVECAKNGVGSIILVSSIGGISGQGSSSYVASKGAMRSLTQHFSSRFGAEKVRINCIYPGNVITDMTRLGFTNEKIAPMFLPKIPLARFGQPEDVGYMALFLATDAASWVTGQHFVVDGGRLSNPDL